MPNDPHPYQVVMEVVMAVRGNRAICAPSWRHYRRNGR